MNYSLLDHLLNPVLVIDKTKAIVYFNHISSTYFKLPPRKLKLIKSISDLINSNDTNVFDKIEDIIKNGEPSVTREIEISLPEDSKTKRTVILKMIPINELVLIHVWDMSIEKQLQEKYKKQIIQLKDNHEQIMMADKLTALGELISGIGHEVSNPMMIVNDRLLRLNESLIKKDLQSAKINLTDIEREVMRVNKIISNMKSFVGNDDEEVSVISLRSVIEESVEFIKNLEILGDIRLVVTIKEDQLILANNVKIQQVLINLIKNSIDALANIKNPQIQIEIESDIHEQVSIVRIKDNGSGIPKEVQPKLFDMFYTSKEFGEGTGLGLSISQKIVESYSGHIILEDTKIGASFVVQIPFIEFSSFTRSNDYLNGEKDIEDPKVLLMGENVDLLNSLYKKLEGEGLVVVISQNFKALDSLIDFYDAHAIILTSEQDLATNIPIIKTKSSQINISELLRSVSKR